MEPYVWTIKLFRGKNSFQSVKGVPNLKEVKRATQTEGYQWEKEPYFLATKT